MPSEPPSCKIQATHVKDVLGLTDNTWAYRALTCSQLPPVPQKDEIGTTNSIQEEATEFRKTMPSPLKGIIMNRSFELWVEFRNASKINTALEAAGEWEKPWVSRYLLQSVRKSSCHRRTEETKCEGFCSNIATRASTIQNVD